MLSLKLAIKNLMGAGLRTWLNVAVLSFAFVIIVFYNGMLDGWNLQAKMDTQNWEIGHGQLWHPEYDRYDPFSLQDAHAVISPEIHTLVENDRLTPILITQAVAYTEGRMINLQLKGIEPNQKILELPTQYLNSPSDEIGAMVGKRMAKSLRLKQGDQLLIRWRDKNGTFDAREITITEIFDSNVPTIDNGQLWIALKNLQQMTGMANEATYLVASETFSKEDIGFWEFVSQKTLLQEFDMIMQQKKGSSMIISGLLLAIALLAIFDTQVLSIFRRQKEIGTYIALGMTRLQVVKIFTVEGGAHSLLALLVGAIYGIPLLLYLQNAGIPMPEYADDAGVAISEKIIPAYSLGMLTTTTLLVIISATIVSYFPARRISKMKPTDAIKGKIQ